MLRNGLEPWHVILIVAVFVLLFGSRKLPEAARGIGKSLRILKAETRALREDGETREPEPSPARLAGEAAAAPESAPAAQPTPVGEARQQG